MGEWNYNRTEGEFKQIPEGRYRVRVKSAEKAVSKSGNDMLVLQFEVSGYAQILYHYIVFLADRPEVTNRMLTQFFDSFKDIKEGDFNMQNWIGKIGGAQVKHDDEGRAKIHYFLREKQVEELPAWKEYGKMPEAKDGFVEVPEGVGDELPFF